MPNVFFYTIAVGFVSGIVCRSFFDLGAEEVLLLFMVSFACALVWRARGGVFRAPLFFASLVLFAFAVGLLRLDVAESNIPRLGDRVGEPISFDGVIVREPDAREASVQLYVEDVETETIVLVRTHRLSDVAYGDRVVVEGVLESPEAFMTDVGREFDYPGYLKARGVRYVLTSTSLTVVGHGEGSVIIGALLHAKEKFLRSIEAAIPEPAASLGEGITLGVKRALGEDLEGVFRDVGLIHIVVLSGYNIMIVIEYLTRLLSFFLRPRMQMVVGIAAIALFALLVGLSASVVRASIMAALILLARSIGRTYMIVRALVLAGVVMLLINPYLLVFDPGFQLSFLATLGLIVLAPLLEKQLYVVPARFGLREVLVATLATQLFVFPFILYEMGTFSVVSVLANVLVLPVVPIAMLLVFLTGVAGLASPFIALLPAFFAYLTLTYSIAVAELLAALPFASFAVESFPFWGVVMFYVVIGVIVYRLSVKTSACYTPRHTDGVLHGRNQGVFASRGNGSAVTLSMSMHPRGKPARHSGRTSKAGEMKNREDFVHASVYDDWEIVDECGAVHDEKIGRARSARPTNSTFPFR